MPSSLQGAKRRSNPKPRRTTGLLRGACHRAGHFRPGALARNDASTRVLATHPRPSSAKAVARMERSEIRGRPTSLNAAPGLRCAPSRLQKKEAERRQTYVSILRILRCGARCIAARRLSAFHRGSRRQGVSPFGSAQGQASWDAAGRSVLYGRLNREAETLRSDTGVTRARLVPVKGKHLPDRS